MIAGGAAASSVPINFSHPHTRPYHQVHLWIYGLFIALLLLAFLICIGLFVSGVFPDFLDKVFYVRASDHQGSGTTWQETLLRAAYYVALGGRSP